MPIAKIRIQTQNLDSSSFVDTSDAVKSNEAKSRDAFISLVAHQSINLAKQSFQNSVSMIGISTGDYAKQEMIENIMSITSQGISLVGSFVVNPYLGIANAVSMTTNEIFKHIKIYKEEQKRNIVLEQINQRSGNSTINGSRTGN